MQRDQGFCTADGGRFDFISVGLGWVGYSWVDLSLSLVSDFFFSISCFSIYLMGSVVSILTPKDDVVVRVQYCSSWFCVWAPSSVSFHRQKCPVSVSFCLVIRMLFCRRRVCYHMDDMVHSGNNKYKKKKSALKSVPIGTGFLSIRL